MSGSTNHHRFTFELSTVELDVVWRAAHLGDLPPVVDVPSPGATHAGRAELERRVWTDLVERGLADDHGYAHWRLTDLLRVLAYRRWSVQLRIFGKDATRAILAKRGHDAVLGVLEDRFGIVAVADTGLTATLLGLLPDVPAGTGYSVSTSTAAFAEAAAATTQAGARAVLRRHGLSADDAHTLLAMTTGSVRTAQIVVELRDVGGRVVRARPVSIHDTPTGRYRTIRTVSGSEDHLTVTPATTTSLAAALDQPVSETR